MIKITNEVKSILKQCIITEKVLYLPKIQLDRELYKQVNDVLVGLGAKWNTKTKGHIFEYSITAELEKVIETGTYTNWKKETDFFYTPSEVVKQMLGYVSLNRHATFTIFEPSAGVGHLLDLAKQEFYKANFICVEMNPNHCEKLREKGYNPINSKFEDTTITNYDLVLMNPPFTYQCEHIQKAYEGLNNGGQLISVASRGLMETTRGKEKKFQEWIAKTFENQGNFGWNKLPSGSFKESGTSVECIILVLEKYEH